MVARWLACASAMVTGCASRPAPVAPAPASARVEVTATTCIAPAEVEARLGEVLRAHDAMASGLVLDVRADAGASTTALQLRALRANGDVGLDRQYTLAASDCASAPQLLALAVDRWLSAFPEWAVPPPPPPPPAPPSTHATAVVLAGAVNTLWRPLGVDAQAAALIDRGTDRDRLGASLLVRASVPQDAGSGRFQLTSALAGATWRHRDDGFELRVEARGGVLLVTGLGFTESASDWLPWWEGAVFGGRRFGWGTLGLEVAATALQHRAVTRDRLVAEDIPMVRIGLAGTLGVWAQDL